MVEASSLFSAETLSLLSPLQVKDSDAMYLHAFFGSSNRWSASTRCLSKARHC